MVDNINTIYVAMTRAALGMHLIAKQPSAKVLAAIESGAEVQFSDFTQMLYHFAVETGMAQDKSDSLVQFFEGQMPDFKAYAKDEREDMQFVVSEGDGYPSIPLNPQAGDAECDVRERGRLKFSADSLDFFSDEGEAGIEASNRIRGIVLHDILAQVKVPADIHPAVRNAQSGGLLTADEAEVALAHLTDAVAKVGARGWFPENPDALYNETSLIDTDGAVYRPDRVLVNAGKVIVVDYKFGEHRHSYEKQVKKYMDMWRRMGYEDVSGFLWYVDTGNVVELR
jgi:ATP-dependent exoDNAse (exonuclease V) beta subunit